MPSALIFVANGTEEMEFTIVYDTLVRGGVKCTSCFVPAKDEAEPNTPIVTCSRGVRVVADTTLSAISESTISESTISEDFDILIVPGGMKGAETISQNEIVKTMIREYNQKEKVVGMICAGSLAALTSGLPRQKLTSHPSVKDHLVTAFEYVDESVAVSGKLITSRGPGSAFNWALKIVEIVQGKDARNAVEGPMVFPAGTIG